MRFLILAAVSVLAACASTPSAPPADTPAAATASPIAASLPRGDGVSVNPAEAPAGAYALDARHASVLWRVRHLGIGLYTARFDTFSGALNFNPQNPAASTLDVSIAANSVSTGLVNQQGERAFDREIAQAFGAQAHPAITFVSRTIEVTGPTSGLITGDLSLNGQTHPVTLEASFHGGRFVQLRGKHVIGFSGRTIIRRSQWGVNNWTMFVGDEVEILVDAEFIQQ
jgi:polyisoprenoid-binding protein YceI